MENKVAKNRLRSYSGNVMSSSSPPRNIIYLDNAATTPLHPYVKKSMIEAMDTCFANPSSRHSLGLAAEACLRTARSEIAQTLNVCDEQIVFTSGATESNAMAILGTARKQKKRGHLLVSAIEHPSVLKNIESLSREGFRIDKIPVTPQGCVHIEKLAELLQPDTGLVAVMAVNNETGILQPLEQVAQTLRVQNPEAMLLVDAAQGFSQRHVQHLMRSADLVTLSSHKLNGPKGVGCLVLKQGRTITPLWQGGEQEFNRRPGTENVIGIVGFSAAAKLHAQRTDAEIACSSLFLDAVRQNLPNVFLLGGDVDRASHILCLAIPKVPAEALVNLLDEHGVIISSGSACHSRKSLRSHVLDAMHIPRDHGVVRVSFSITTTREEVLIAADVFHRCVAQLS